MIRDVPLINRCLRFSQALIWRGLLLASVGGLSTFISLELYLRWLNPIALRVRGYEIVLPKNVTYVFKNNRIRGCDPIITHRRNSLGLRGAEPPLNSRQVLPIIAVGGSTTECYYLSEGQTWPDVLGATLAREIPKLWINNAGLDGHSTFGNLILLRSCIVPLRPHFVLFLLGANDLERSDLNTYDLGISANESTQKTGKTSMQRLMDHSLALSFFRNLPRVGLAWKGRLFHQSIDLTKRSQEADVSSDAPFAIDTRVTAQCLAGYRARLKAIIQECRRHHIVPVFITQPALFGPGRDDVTGVDLSDLQVPGYRSGRSAWNILELYNNATRTVAKEEGVALIDLAARMRRSSRYFYDYFHFTIEGAKEVARIIAGEFSPIAKRVVPAG